MDWTRILIGLYVLGYAYTVWLALADERDAYRRAGLAPTVGWTALWLALLLALVWPLTLPLRSIVQRLGRRPVRRRWEAAERLPVLGPEHLEDTLITDAEQRAGVSLRRRSDGLVEARDVWTDAIATGADGPEAVRALRRLLGRGPDLRALGF